MNTKTRRNRAVRPVRVGGAPNNARESHDGTARAGSLRSIYEALLALAGRRVCPVEDWHSSKWRIVRDKRRRLQLERRS